MAAHRIIANPNAVVGSIGVISAGPRLPGLLIGSTSASASPSRAATRRWARPGARTPTRSAAKEEQLVESIYDACVARVAAGRHMTTAGCASWRRRGVARHPRAGARLIDEIGDLERRSISPRTWPSSLPGALVVGLPRPFMLRLADRFGTSLASSVADELEVRLADRIRLGRSRAAAATRFDARP